MPAKKAQAPETADAHPIVAAIAAAAQVAKPTKPEESSEQRRQRINELRQARKLQDEIDGENAIRATLQKLAKETAAAFPPPPPYKPPPRTGKHASVETVVQHMSDWHTYEEVDAQKTRGINEYNALIAGQRVKRVVDAHLAIKDRMERGGGWRFEELVIPINGDFVPGTIHELERHTDADNVVLAVYGTARLLAYAIRDLAAAYPRTRVYCTSGNHGRLGDAKKVQSKDPLRNWDSIIAFLAYEHLRLTPNIVWRVPNSWGARWDVYRWGFLQQHGHFIKSWNSISYYGIDRMTRNATSLEAVRGWTPHYFLTGHFHTASQIQSPAGKVMMNGSLVGASEGVIDGMGKAEPPVQQMFGVHPEHGLTFTFDLRADAPADAPGYDVAPWMELQR
jgi:hypothetical protein